MGKEPKDDQTVRNWEQILAAIRTANLTAHDNLLKCKVETCNKRIVVLFSPLTRKQNDTYLELIRDATSQEWNHRVTVKWKNFVKGDTFLKPYISKPGPLLAEDVPDIPREEYPITTKIRGFYPNNHVILTDMGNARCRDARAFTMQMEVPVVREGDWLVIKGQPRKKFKY